MTKTLKAGARSARKTRPTERRAGGEHYTTMYPRATSILLLILLPRSALAQDATWLATPSSGDFNTDANWTPVGVPTGTAFFGSSAITALSFSSYTTTLDGVTLNPGASLYTLASNSGTSVAFTGAGIVVNGGGLTLNSNFFLDFYNSSTAGAALLNNGYVLTFHDSSSAGTGTLTNTSTGYVYFNDSSTAGGATVVNNGVSIQFANNSSAANAHLVNNSLLYFSDTATAGSSVIDNSSSGDLRFYNNSTAANAHITNDQYLYFNDASTAGNATIVNNGLLYFYSTATGGSAQITNNQGALIDISGSLVGGVTVDSISGAGTIALGGNRLVLGGDNQSTTISGVIQDGGLSGGTGGGLTKNGSGTLTLTGNNTYTGSTVIGGGTLQLGTGGSSGSLMGDVVNNGAFVLDRGDSYTYSGSVSGTGIVQLLGTGNITLSGTSTYTGTTSVNAGILTVNGSIATSTLTTVAAGATLGGTGTVGNTTVASGGTLGYGSSIGTLTIQGQLTMAGSSIYAVAVSPSAADRTNVTGSAALAGSVQATLAPGSYIATRYTILDAVGGLSGKFDALSVMNAPTGFASSLSYDADNVYLNLQLQLAQYPGLSVNQQSVANALVDSFNNTGKIPPVFATLSPAELTQAAGELGTASIQPSIDAMTQFLGVLLDTPETIRGCTDGAADCHSVWGTGYGGTRTTDGNTAIGAHDTTDHVYGALAGSDYAFTPQTRFGFAVGGGGTNFRLGGIQGSGSSDMIQAGAFGRHSIGAAYLSGAVAYGWQDVTADRTLTIAGMDRLRSQFDSSAFSGRIEGGYGLDPSSPVVVTPYAAGQTTSLQLPAYSERVSSGSDTFAADYAARTAVASRTEVGFRLHGTVPVESATLSLWTRAAWAHDFDTNRAVNAAFETLPDTDFVVRGASAVPNPLLLSANAALQWRNGLSLATTFDSELAAGSRSYSGSGTVRYVW